MLRLDLEAAGIPSTVEGPDGPLFADFRALRHSYLPLDGRAGIDHALSVRRLKQQPAFGVPAAPEQVGTAQPAGTVVAQ